MAVLLLSRPAARDQKPRPARWLGWVAILAGLLLFLQAFDLGGVIATFGLVLDLIGFVLFLIFILVSSVILLTRQSAVPNIAAQIK